MPWGEADIGTSLLVCGWQVRQRGRMHRVREALEWSQEAGAVTGRIEASMSMETPPLEKKTSSSWV